MKNQYKNLYFLVVVVVVQKIMGFSKNPPGAEPQNLQKSWDFRRTRPERHPRTRKKEKNGRPSASEGPQGWPPGIFNIRNRDF